ncbi:MAG: hypothetical protein IJT21_03800 [Synergistaceae bacterium]|nr:hypothetical protein [Synergistaceae bacterium]
MSKVNQSLTKKLFKKLKNATLMNDEFMTLFFRINPECIQFMLRIIMNKYDLIVQEARVQHEMEGAHGTRAVKYDIFATDSKGTRYDIEFQKESSGASPYRARFNIAILDANSLQPGEKHNLLRERQSAVIFITQKDYFKRDRPLYSFPRFDPETGINLNDGSTIIYVNGSYNNIDTALGKLIHDFNCSHSSEALYTEFAGALTNMESKGEEEVMSVIDEIVDEARAEARAEAIAEGEAKGKAEGIAQGKAQGIAQGIKDTALNLIRMGVLAFNQIAEACNLSLAQVQELAKSIGR